MLDSNRLQRLRQTSLWDFALELYAKPGVEHACLTLQDDAGLDVCELLFHCWLYQHGIQAAPDALGVIREERLGWQQQVTEALRQLRRELKPLAAESGPIAALRKTIQQAELQAERENLQRWQAWAWQASEHDRRLINIEPRLHDVDKWLHDTLFNALFDTHVESEQRSRESVLRAFEVLACQLDHLSPSR
ncbi:TIGR02444 family protein [Vreelandella nigrificans]|uniref:TIGR02444 family protein n=1 Tax=Vreelandella nigrificans TaxID=2042704 RepID=A0A2A4HQA3_9GAMM|nr:TIGR02444 family protein [Halomonas nigrificans]PCF96234.1 TIGR02444 family protein [Halomonas nigrificans]